MGVGTNTGHGHVWERPDGIRARCGGPRICSECARDQARLVEKVAQPPIRVIDGKEYYVLPVHLNLIDKYGMAEIVQNAQTFGISLVEMTDGEMKLVKDWRKGESNGCPQEGTSEKDQDHGC